MSREKADERVMWSVNASCDPSLFRVSWLFRCTQGFGDEIETMYWLGGTSFEVDANWWDWVLITSDVRFRICSLWCWIWKSVLCFNDKSAAALHLFVFMCILFLCHYNCVYVIFAGKCNKEKLIFYVMHWIKWWYFQALLATEYLMLYFWSS